MPSSLEEVERQLDFSTGTLGLWSSNHFVWRVDKADPEGAWLGEPWSGASIALVDAALALGAPDLIGMQDSESLTGAWRDAIGPLPA